MDDRYWPARPEYLRRGTPVVWINPWTGVATPGVAIDATTSAMVESRDTPEGPMHPSCRVVLGEEYLDLSDATARAHVAWAWTSGPDSSGWRGPIPKLEAARNGAVAHYWILCRMASGDESVTVPEARAALAWAESVGAP